MKTKLLLLAITFFASATTYGQCTRTGAMNPDATPAYDVTGTADLTFETDGTKEITFNNFATVQGLDLRVYLSTTSFLGMGGNELEITNSPLIDDNGNPGGNAYLGDPLTGTKVFTVPTSVNLNDYNHIIIQCIIADMQWGRADLGALSGPDCATLSITEQVLENSLQLFPNPTTDDVTITNPNQLDLNVTVFNVLGKQVLNVNNVSLRKQILDLSSLKSGVYLMKIEAEGVSTTKRLVKQ